MDERGYMVPMVGADKQPPQVPEAGDRKEIAQALRNEKTVRNFPLRIVERKTGPTTWEQCRMMDLQPQDTFRMFEGHKRRPVAAGSHFLVTSPPFIDKKSGVPSVDATPVKKPRIGRNQPCPCGSGVKYKRCCKGRD